MWEGDEGSRVSIKEIGSFPGMSAVLEAPGADAFHPWGAAVPPRCLAPTLEELARELGAQLALSGRF